MSSCAGRTRPQWNADVALLTPFQTVGPFLHLGLRAGLEPLSAGRPDSLVSIRGHLLDGDGAGIPDGVLEWWHPELPSVQRSFTGEGGSFAITTIKPSTLATGDGRVQAPHLAIRVLGRGMQTQYLTRLYFEDEADTAHDAILNLVPAHRRPTLMARPIGSREYRFDVVVQGPNETVFFDI
jgi:protocatechuate 3,4-dioxygenase, alpha subunit